MARRPVRVAIVGSGLAGLATAYLLHNDQDRRYEVTLFEQASTLAFDAASVAVKNGQTGAIERIDLPMRASAGGYYANLMRMYDHLGILLHPVRFLFVFARALPSKHSSADAPDGAGAGAGAEAGAMPGSYFVHASNLHQIPPPRPASRGLVLHMVEILYLIVCHFWFSAACFLVQPSGRETLAAYLQRIWLPRRYASHYLLPLMSSVSTCSHAELLAFPASDIVTYKKLSHGRQHYVVCGGINQVQSRLAEGLADVRLGARVLQVERRDNGAIIHWQSSGDMGGRFDQQSYDRVVLAVSPDVAARIFSPLRSILSKIPTLQVESSVLEPNPGRHSIILDHAASKGCSHHGHSSPSQVITFRSSFSQTASRTEALHAMPSGVIVQTCPLEPDADPKRTLRTARFTRTLRTAESRAVVQRIMRSRNASRKIDTEDNEEEWVNGQGNVWLTGAWCWDGMVLLEGCIVSAMRVADEFGVTIPWRTITQ